MKATARDVRYRLRSIMEAVDRGETVFITHRGKVRAKIVPAASGKTGANDDNPFVGMWKDRQDMRNVRSYVRRIRQGRFS